MAVKAAAKAPIAFLRGSDESRLSAVTTSEGIAIYESCRERGETLVDILLGLPKHERSRASVNFPEPINFDHFVE
jgi:hypothetical protein